MAATSACELIGGDACLKKQASNLPCGDATPRPSPNQTLCPPSYAEAKKTPSTLTLSDTGARLMRVNEGFKPNPYNDSAGNCTVGIGHLIHFGKCNGDATERPYAGGLTESAGIDLFKNTKSVTKMFDPS